MDELNELPGQSVGLLGDQDVPRLGGHLHPGGPIGKPIELEESVND